MLSAFTFGPREVSIVVVGMKIRKKKINHDDFQWAFLLVIRILWSLQCRGNVTFTDGASNALQILSG